VEPGAGEAGLEVHGIDLGIGVGVAGARCREHCQREGCRHGGRDSVLVGDEFERGGAAAGGERGTDFIQQANAGWGIKVVEEIGEKHHVVGTAEIRPEGVAGKRFPTRRDASLLGVGAGDFEDGAPV